MKTKILLCVILFLLFLILIILYCGKKEYFVNTHHNPKKMGTNLAVSHHPLASIDPSMKPPKSFRKWYDSGLLTPVRNQGQCNSCWAFATTGILGDRISILTNGKIKENMSTQYFISCDTDEGKCTRGSTLPSAFNHLQTNIGPIGGVPLEKDVPYQSQDGTNVPTCENLRKKLSTKKIYSFKPESPVNLARVENESFQNVSSQVLSENALRMKQDLMKNGPICAAMKVYQDLQMKQGDWDKPYTYDGSSPYVGGHAIEIVGWDTEASTGKEYWIVKNSWGSNWGKNGYYYHYLGDQFSLLESNAHSAIPDMSLIDGYSNQNNDDDDTSSKNEIPQTNKIPTYVWIIIASVLSFMFLMFLLSIVLL